MEKSDQVIVWTIGHSRHAIEEFLKLLHLHGVTELVDVRSRPSSRFCPQFNQKALRSSLQGVGIGYEHIPALGGLHDGAGEGEAFEKGIHELVQKAGRYRTAIMCSEAKFEACHRSYMVGRKLVALGHRVQHVLPGGAVVDGTQG